MFYIFHTCSEIALCVFHFLFCGGAGIVDGVQGEWRLFADLCTLAHEHIPLSSCWLISVGRHRWLHKVPVGPNNELVHPSFLRIDVFYNICEFKIFRVWLALAEPPHPGILLFHALRLGEEDEYLNCSDPSLAQLRHV